MKIEYIANLDFTEFNDLYAKLNSQYAIPLFINNTEESIIVKIILKNTDEQIDTNFSVYLRSGIRSEQILIGLWDDRFKSDIIKTTIVPKGSIVELTDIYVPPFTAIYTDKGDKLTAKIFGLK